MNDFEFMLFPYSIVAPWVIFAIIVEFSNGSHATKTLKFNIFNTHTLYTQKIQITYLFGYIIFAKWNQLMTKATTN